MIKITPANQYLNAKIEVTIGDKTYGVSYTEDALGPALDMLCDHVMHKELGFTKHDLLMKIGEQYVHGR